MPSFPLPILLALLLFLQLPSIVFVASVRVDLSGSDGAWRFRSADGNYSGTAHRVPGDIYADLQAAGHIGNPLYGERDLDYAWVGHQQWTYERDFELAGDVPGADFVLLQAKGLDTVATVFINEQRVLEGRNQFIEYTVDVKNAVKQGTNTIRVEFQSPVTYALQEHKEYERNHSHVMPPECWPPIYNGECHINMVRKVQASFSWDWGPSFPTVGIWQPIYLEYFNGASLQAFSPLVQVKDNGDFLVNASASIICSPYLDRIDVTLTIPEIGESVTNPKLAINCSDEEHWVYLGQIYVPKEKVELWWPNGYGTQRLYSVNLEIQAGGQSLSTTRQVGFRSIKLVQDYVDPYAPNKGRHFYFKVNSVPIFLKGSNWIPISPFPARDHSLRRRFLFNSMRVAHINALRVWGGGMYEAEEFYHLADTHGILIWHDFMFACALYSADEPFLANVRTEITQQVRRLRTHPSILVWAGNNENEFGIQGGWFYRAGYDAPQMKEDYLALYKGLMKPMLASLDPTREYLLSSPSNGAKTEEEGGIATTPGDDAYGDIHYYNEFVNLWQDGVYQTPRCASEYGVQSLPLRDTMAGWLPESDLHYGSKAMTDRQHHPGGVVNLMKMTFEHFDIPLSSKCPSNPSVAGVVSCGEAYNSTNFFDDFALLTQFHQAVAVQVQSEHYRRWRGRLANDTGHGNTMCAMYWQLNDVWAAPSWSSIDYNLNWKALHYFMKRTFASVIVSMYLDASSTLQIYVVSDQLQEITGPQLKLDVFVLGSGDFEPIYSQPVVISAIPPLSSTPIPLPTGMPDLAKRPRITKGTTGGDTEGQFLIRAALAGPDGLALAPPAYLLPDKLFTRSVTFGQPVLKSVERTTATDGLYSISVEAVGGVIPFVWLDLTPTLKRDGALLYHFSDNAFPMCERSVKVNLTIVHGAEKEIKLSDLVVRHL